MFSLESPYRGDSNKYIQYTIFNIKKKDTLNYPKFAAMDIFARDSGMSLKHSVVIKLSVFVPPKGIM